MQELMDLLQNKMLLSGLFGWFCAQMIKMIIEVVKGGFSVKRLAGSGGMPSTHSATVTALAISAGIVYGFGSGEFALAFFLAMIVMYDAMGVRLTTGKQSRILNRLNEKKKAAGEEPLMDKPLEEKMGHTLPEVAVGFLIGILAAELICRIFPL